MAWVQWFDDIGMADVATVTSEEARDEGVQARLRRGRHTADASNRATSHGGNKTMKPLPHHFDVHLSGGPSGYAELSTAAVPALRTAPPADYDGPGDAWSPEHLLLASVALRPEELFLKAALIASSQLLDFTAETPSPRGPNSRRVERTNAFLASSSISMAIANGRTINQAVHAMGAVPKSA